MEVAFVALGLSYLYRTRNLGKSRTTRLGFWVASAFVMAAVRWWKAPLQEGCGEAEISELLGMPWYINPWVLLPPACPALANLLWTHVREQTLIPLAIGFGFGIAGFALWVLFIGPLMLPKIAG